MKKTMHRNAQATQRWKAHVEKIVNSHLGHYMPNEPDFVAFIASAIAEDVEEDPP